MPSTSAKQHRFMQAVAHSPSFAKKAGVSQSVGKDFSAADKGKTFNKGGMMKKTKRYFGGDLVDDNDPEAQKVFRSDMTEISDEERMPRRSAAAPQKTSTVTNTAVKTAAAAPEKASTASSSRSNVDQIPVSGFSDYKGNYPTRSSFEEGANTAARYFPGTGAGVKTGVKFAIRKAGELANKLSKSKVETLAQGRERVAGRETANVLAKIDARKSAAKMARDRKSAEKENEVRDYLRGASYGDRATGHRAGGFVNKGGGVMESKKMMGKEVAFMQKKGAPKSMIKHEKAEMGMKKGGMAHGGMPMKDGKPAFMKKKMMGGGMAYAKGGGIESRGKTKGTIIRMAAGGSVSSRADGIAQRGKTKFKNY